MHKKKNLTYLLLGVSGLLLALLYHHFQSPNNYTNIQLSDSYHYEKIYEYFKGNSEDYHVKFPINSRVLIPFLAAQLWGDDINLNFFIVNTLFAILALISIYKLMDFYDIEWKIIMLSLLWFSLHWAGPFRQNAYNPVNVDIHIYFFEPIFLLLIVKKKYWLLLLLSPIAIASKEIFLAIIIAFFVISLIWNFYLHDKSISIGWTFAIMIFGIFTKYMLNYYYPPISSGINSIIVMAFHLREMLLNPVHILRWFLSLFAAFGAFLFLAFKNRNILSARRDELLIHILSLAVLSLSFLGGMDYTRLIILGSPYVLISILKIGKPSFQEVLLAFSISILLTRFWQLLPDPAGDISQYDAWMPERAEIKSLMLWSCTALISLIIFIVVKKIIRSLTNPDH